MTGARLPRVAEERHADFLEIAKSNIRRFAPHLGECLCDVCHFSMVSIVTPYRNVFCSAVIRDDEVKMCCVWMPLDGLRLTFSVHRAEDSIKSFSRDGGIEPDLNLFYVGQSNHRCHVRRNGTETLFQLAILKGADSSFRSVN